MLMKEVALSVEYDNLASAELERHREGMLYADRKMAKAGDFETVARNLQSRSYTRLVVGVVAAIFLFIGGGFGAIWAVAILLYCVLDFSHTKRTHETILRMQEAASSGRENTA